MLTINEIFHSIQGESTHAGRPCVFVRLTACDLRCSWCDTPYAFHEGRKMSIDEVFAWARARKIVRELERSIVHYGDTTPFVAERMREEGMGYASAVAMEEATLLDFNRRRRPGQAIRRRGR